MYSEVITQSLRGLILDSSLATASYLATELARIGVSLQGEVNPDLALTALDDYDFFVIELEPAPRSGLALVQKWRQYNEQKGRHCAFLLLRSGEGSDEEKALLTELGEIEVISPDIGLEAFCSALERAQRGAAERAQRSEARDSLLAALSSGAIGAAAEAKRTLLAHLELFGEQKGSLIADVFEKTAELEEGLALINQLRPKEPSSLGLINAGGRLLLRMGRLAEACRIFKILDGVAPRHIERLERLAQLYLRLNRPEEGVRTMRELLRLAPPEEGLKFDFFEMLTNSGFIDQARKFASIELGILETARYLNNKGVLLARTRQAAKAMPFYNLAMQMLQGDRSSKELPRIRFNIALAHLRSGPEGLHPALAELKALVAQSPQFNKAVALLASVEERLATQVKVNHSSDSVAWAPIDLESNGVSSRELSGSNSSLPKTETVLSQENSSGFLPPSEEEAEPI